MSRAGTPAAHPATTFESRAPAPFEGGRGRHDIGDPLLRLPATVDVWLSRIGDDVRSRDQVVRSGSAIRSAQGPAVSRGQRDRRVTATWKRRALAAENHASAARFPRGKWTAFHCHDLPDREHLGRPQGCLARLRLIRPSGTVSVSDRRALPRKPLESADPGPANGRGSHGTFGYSRCVVPSTLFRPPQECPERGRAFVPQMASALGLGPADPSWTEFAPGIVNVSTATLTATGGRSSAAALRRVVAGRPGAPGQPAGCGAPFMLRKA